MGNCIVERKPKEVMLIDLPDGETIVVTNFGKKNVKLGFAASPKIRFRRGELKPEPTKEGCR